MTKLVWIAAVIAAGCGGEGLQRGDTHEVEGRTWEYPCPNDLDLIDDAVECVGFSAAAEALDGEGETTCAYFLVGEYGGATGCCIPHGGGTGFFHVCSEEE